MTVEYGPLVIGDADRCAQLEAQLFPGDDPWPAVAFIRELESDHNHYVAARLDGHLIGYAGISRLGRKPPYEYEIHTIGVDEACQGRGIGRALLDGLLRIAADDPIFLEVRTDNVAAISLYEGNGFEVMGLRKKYYQASGADAFTMRRPGRGAAT